MTAQMKHLAQIRPIRINPLLRSASLTILKKNIRHQGRWAEVVKENEELARYRTTVEALTVPNRMTVPALIKAKEGKQVVGIERTTHRRNFTLAETCLKV